MAISFMGSGRAAGTSKGNVDTEIEFSLVLLFMDDLPTINLYVRSPFKLKLTYFARSLFGKYMSGKY